MISPVEKPVYKGGPIDPRDENTPDAFVSRDPELIRLTGKHPFNAEPSLKKLEEAGFITPNSLHFVRNHGPVPQLSWDAHRLEITGLVNKPVTLTMQDILNLPSVTLPITMVCAGNRRKEQNMVRQSVGFGWGAAGVSTACWTGVYLRDVLNISAGGLKDNAEFICFEGCDKTNKGGYGTSITAQRAMSDHYDVLLAYKMNGEFLPPDHGYPLRVLVPGTIGGRSVKWLSQIHVSHEESTNTYHYNDNKVFPPQVLSAEQATAEAWWQKHDYAIYDLNINSAITSPDHDERIPLENLQGTYITRGYAYTGGNRRILRVEVSLDGGKTWLLADMERPSAQELVAPFGALGGSSYYTNSRNWTWVRWSLPLQIADLVRADELVVRAWDSSQNTQPENMTWNLMGMMNNCWFRVKLQMERAPILAITCSHPTLAGPKPGGWMDKERPLSVEATPVENKGGLKRYTMAEVEKHQSETDCWIVVGGHVYDCTPFLKDHPGGASSILITAGTDTTEEFDAIHSSKAQAMLQDYLIGQLEEEASDASTSSVATVTDSLFSLQKPTPSTTSLASMNQEPFLHPKQWKAMTLESITHLSTTLRLFRFVFDNQPFGLPVGQHAYLKLPLTEPGKAKSIMRAYTPVEAGNGYVVFLIKIYYPLDKMSGGAFTMLLDKLRVGETIQVKGPLGEFEYHGERQYTIHGKPPHQHVKQIGMIAGGTGITPMWQVLDALRNDHDPPFVSLIYCVRYQEDLALIDELEALQELLTKERFHIRYLLSNPPPTGWKHGTGYLTATEFENHMFKFDKSDTTDNKDRLVLLCGSEAMIESCCKPIIAQVMGDEFASTSVFVF